MTALFSQQPRLAEANQRALLSPRLRIVNADAFGWLEQQADTYDVIVVDFPDPSNFALGKLYTTSFYALMDQHLAAGGYAVIQTTSPLIARRSFWTVAATVEAVGLTATPYHAHVPSFGEWGFVVASRAALASAHRLAARSALPDAGRHPAAAELPARHGPPASRAEPVVQSGVGADLRIRVGPGPRMRRRTLLAAGAAGLAACGLDEAPAFTSRWVGASAERGHRLRTKPARCRRRR